MKHTLILLAVLALAGCESLTAPTPHPDYGSVYGTVTPPDAVVVLRQTITACAGGQGGSSPGGVTVGVESCLVMQAFPTNIQRAPGEYRYDEDFTKWRSDPEYTYDVGCWGDWYVKDSCIGECRTRDLDVHATVALRPGDVKRVDIACGDHP